MGLRCFGNVQGNHVGDFEQRAKRRHWPCIAQSELLLDIKKYYLHAERFGKDTYLAALQALLDRTYNAMKFLISVAIPEQPQTFVDYVDDERPGAALALRSRRRLSRRN